jgi:hypothetical protein
MSLAFKNTTSEVTRSTAESQFLVKPLSIVKAAIRDERLSHGASRLASFLVLAAGERGYVNYLLENIVRDMGKVSLSSVKRYAKELSRCGYVEGINRGHHSNCWVIPLIAPQFAITMNDSRSQLNGELLRRLGHPSYQLNGEPCISSPVSYIQDSLQDSKDVNVRVPDPRPGEPATERSVAGTENVTLNVSSASHGEREEEKRSKPRKPAGKTYDRELLNEIEETTGDRKSRGAFIQILRDDRVRPEHVHMALSATRAKLMEESGVNGGAYFISEIKRLTGFTFTSERPTLTVVKKAPLGDPPNDEAMTLANIETAYPRLMIPELYDACRASAQKEGKPFTIQVFNTLVRNRYDEIAQNKPQYVRPELGDHDPEPGQAAGEAPGFVQDTSEHVQASRVVMHPEQVASHSGAPGCLQKRRDFNPDTPKLMRKLLEDLNAKRITRDEFTAILEKAQA